MGRGGPRGTYGSPPAGVLLAGAVAGGGLAHEMLVGPVAAQAPVAAGAAVGHGLRRQWPEESGQVGRGPHRVSERPRPALRGWPSVGTRWGRAWTQGLAVVGSPLPAMGPGLDPSPQGIHGHGVQRQNKVSDSTPSSWEPRSRKFSPRAHVLTGILPEGCVAKDRRLLQSPGASSASRAGGTPPPASILGDHTLQTPAGGCRVVLETGKGPGEGGRTPAWGRLWAV